MIKIKTVCPAGQGNNLSGGCTNCAVIGCANCTAFWTTCNSCSTGLGLNIIGTCEACVPTNCV